MGDSGVHRSMPESAVPTPVSSRADHPVWTKAARLVGVGLFLTGIALGVLYYEYRLFHAENLRLEAAGMSPREVAAMRDDDLPDLVSLSRFLLAMSTGSIGVGMTGYGFVLVLSRWRWFTGT